jgi:hypothetical protein
MPGIGSPGIHLHDLGESFMANQAESSAGKDYTHSRPRVKSPAPAHSETRAELVATSSRQRREESRMDRMTGREPFKPF